MTRAGRRKGLCGYVTVVSPLRISLPGADAGQPPPAAGLLGAFSLSRPARGSV